MARGAWRISLHVLEQRDESQKRNATASYHRTVRVPIHPVDYYHCLVISFPSIDFDSKVAPFRPSSATKPTANIRRPDCPVRLSFVRSSQHPSPFNPLFTPDLYNSAGKPVYCLLS